MKQQQHTCGNGGGSGNESTVTKNEGEKKKKETKETKEMSSCTKPLSAPWLLAARLRAGLRQLGMHVPGAIG